MYLRQVTSSKVGSGELTRYNVKGREVEMWREDRWRNGKRKETEIL